MAKRPALLLLGLFTLAILCFVTAEQHFTVSRMIQYDREGAQLGSRRGHVNAPGVAYSNLPQSEENIRTTTTGDKTSSFSKFSKGTKIQRQLVTIHAAEVDGYQIFEDLFNRQGVMGILVILPTDVTSVNRTAFQEAEQFLVKQRTDIPVYFAFESEDLSKLYQSLKQMTRATQHAFQFVVNAREAPIKPKFNLENIEGVLPLSEQTGEPKPSIAIVAHYDTLGVAPTATHGLDDNASGVVALLELAYMFSKLYETSGGRFSSAYNLVFLLTSGGRLNYAGAQRWAQVSGSSVLEQSLAENVEFALCLEALNGEHLYLHISKKTKDEKLLKLYQQLKQTANHMNIPFDIKLKKLDISRSEMNWEHEAFLHNGIDSATLSHLSKAVPQFARSSLIDQQVNVETVERNTRFIAEALSNYMFEAKDQRISIFSGSLSPRKEAMNAWFQTFANISRAAPYSDEVPISTETVTSSLKMTIDQYLSDVNVQQFVFKGKGARFYGNALLDMTVFKSRPFTFEIILMVPIALYLGVIYMFLMGTWKIPFFTKQKKQ